MSFIRGGETITIKRRSATATDDYGNPTYSTTTITVRDALIAVGGTSEPVDPARDAVNASLTIYLPNGTKVHEGDVFLIRGSSWVKDGTAQEWVSPFPASEAGVVVPVRKSRG
jgi:hypothetical protein